ncbi:MAG: hypothetical protein AAFP24_07735, partial [Pseudomonadota bacterium]
QSPESHAQNTNEMIAPIDLSTPEGAVYSMMRAMYQGDTDMVDQVFHETAILRRVTWDAELRPDGLERWRDWVGGLDVGEAHEILFNVTSEQHGPLATVWAPSGVDRSIGAIISLVFWAWLSGLCRVGVSTIASPTKAKRVICASKT